MPPVLGWPPDGGGAAARGLGDVGEAAADLLGEARGRFLEREAAARIAAAAMAVAMELVLAGLPLDGEWMLTKGGYGTVSKGHEIAAGLRASGEALQPEGFRAAGQEDAVFA